MQMSKEKIAITIESKLLSRLDRLVKSKVFQNRSNAIQQAVKEKIDRLESNRLEIECLKLDVKFEQALADEGLSSDIGSWQEY
jgi:Arc/MetJ-type ribon-helix-helix transcriptional regulator